MLKHRHCCSNFDIHARTPCWKWHITAIALEALDTAAGAEAGCSANQQSDTDEPMGNTPEAEHMCVLVYGGFSGDAVEGDLISIDPGVLAPADKKQQSRILKPRQLSSGIYLVYIPFLNPV